MKLHGLVGGRTEVCGPETTLRDAADAMLGAGVGSIAVIDGPRLTGILTERDLLRAAADGVDPTDELVRDWMTVDPDVTSPESEVRDAAKWMLEIGYRHLPVMEDNELLGIVSIKDLLWVLLSDND
ncbi:MAG: CBS domain-containing protein [Acidimicrobiia bacterium]|nr:CBS domain-containing protein [Acidimicrobiia bacterium]